MNTLAAEDNIQPLDSSPILDALRSTPCRGETRFVTLSESRVRLLVAGGLLVFGVGCFVVKYLYPFALPLHENAGWRLQHLTSRLERMVAEWSLPTMAIYPLGLLAILLLERLFPAVPTQPTLSTGLVTDALWVVIEAAAGVLLISWYSRLLYQTYARHLTFLTLPLGPSLPVPLRLAIGVVVLDLTRWCQHWLHHKVPWFWQFHAVHHAQRELNLFSDYRIHFMEHYVRRTVSVLPMLMLGLDSPEVTWWLLLLSWHARLYHANIRTNFGPLRYLFVTPQSHRVHHSRNPEHFDHNYGAMLSVWDYLFQTQYRRYDVYPETGVDDDNFPRETARSVLGVLNTPLRQLLYPFRLARGPKRV